ncbi:MAG: hypothetical protein WBH20_03275 [Oceanisphaera sp.]|uniref:hypothetical protein n=1 Tax=Oceanisphaera sp. TaxID=1929979 RepID=UPI003C719602
MIHYSNAVRNARCAAIAGAIDAGTGPNASLTIYTGPRAASVNAPITSQIAIVELPFPVPSAVSVSGGILTLAPLPETMATGNGEPSWARITDRDGNAVADLDVGPPDSTADVILPAGQIYRGALIAITGATITEP